MTSRRNRGTAMIATMLIALSATACAPRQVAPAGPAAADPDSLARAIVTATTPASPTQVGFTWRLDEAGSAVQGRGVVRYDAPERMRLDLFGPRGETYLIAALADGEFRLPPTAGRGFELPPPALLWAAVGVVAPPPGSTLQAATADGDGARLVYRDPGGDTFTFHVDLAPTPRLRRVERSAGSGVLESVAVDHSAELQPSRATYVDRRSFRELVLETESVRAVASFPESIWRPDGTGDRR